MTDSAEVPTAAQAPRLVRAFFWLLHFAGRVECWLGAHPWDFVHREEPTFTYGIGATYYQCGRCKKRRTVFTTWEDRRND
jgi:hypothetical protein